MVVKYFVPYRNCTVEILNITSKEKVGDLRAIEYNINLLGFDDQQMARITCNDAAAGVTDPDLVPAPPETDTTRKGDLWILGEHRLLCGDSASATDVDRLLDGAVIHLVNADCPYNVKVVTCSPKTGPSIMLKLDEISVRVDTRLN
jgi:hypothetical protein